MADRKESFSNSHFRLLLPWVLRRFLFQRVGSKAQADCAPLRPTWSRPRIGKDYSKQARKCKLPCSRAMANLEECFSNGHLRHLLRWNSRRGFWRARSKALKVCAPIRYLRKESLPSLASQILLLSLQVWEEAQRPRKLLLLPSSRRGKISPPPEQKHWGREAHNARIRLVQWRPPPSIFWSHNQGVGQVLLLPKGKHPKAHCQLIITWKSRRIFQRNWCSQCKKMRPRRQDEP